MDENKRQVLRDHAWKYFSLHAEQRLKSFNFYLILCTVVAGGILAIIRDAKDTSIVIPVSLILPFLSAVFWKLDTRNRQLIDNGEQALMYFEDDPALASPGGTPHVAQILRREKHRTQRDRSWTYRLCFNAVFLVVGFAGIAVAISVLVFC